MLAEEEQDGHQLASLAVREPGTACELADTRSDNNRPSITTQARSACRFWWSTQTDQACFTGEDTVWDTATCLEPSSATATSSLVTIGQPTYNGKQFCHIEWHPYAS